MTENNVYINGFAENSAYLEPVGPIDYGVYTIPIKVTDNANHGGTTNIKVQVCDCTTPSDCDNTRMIPPRRDAPNVTLGVWAILAMILGSLLLLCEYIYSSFM